MKLAVVMVHFGDRQITKASLTGLRNKLGDNIFILVNNSSHDISELTEIIPRTIVLDNRTNVGFAKAVNQGIRRALLDESVGAVWLLNNDAQLIAGSPSQLSITFSHKPSAGIVSPVLLHSGGLYDWGGKYSRWAGTVRHTNFHEKPKTILSVTHVAGAAMCIKREVIEKVGLFDERFFMYYEDLDFCLRVARSGYTIHIAPDVVVGHGEGSSSSISRVITAWKSHFLFVIKHIPRTAYLTSIMTDFVTYPLILLRAIVMR